MADEFKKLVNLDGERNFLGQVRSYVAAFVTTFLYGLLKNGSTKSTISSRTTTKVSGNSFGMELDANGDLSVNIPNASTSANGLMSSTDKTALGKKTERVYVGSGIEIEEMAAIDGVQQASGAGTGTDTSTSEKYLKLFARLRLSLKSYTKLTDSATSETIGSGGGKTVAVNVDKLGFLAVPLKNSSGDESGLMSAAQYTKLAGIEAGAKKGTVTKVSTGAGLTGGDITTSGTIKAKLKSETADTDNVPATLTSGGIILPIKVDKAGYLAIRIPFCSSSQSGVTSASDYSNINNALTNLNSGYSGLINWKNALTLAQIAGYQDLIDDITADIDEKVSTLYKPKGSIVGTGLVQSLLDQSEVGWVYNVTDAFTTTNLFVEGAGKTYPAGTNVVVITQGSGSSATKKFDVLAGFVDIPNAYEVITYSATSEEWNANGYYSLGNTVYTQINNAWTAGRLPVLQVSLGGHSIATAIPMVKAANGGFIGIAQASTYIIRAEISSSSRQIFVRELAYADEFGLATATEIRDLFNTKASASSGNPTTLGTADANATIAGTALPDLMPVQTAASQS